MGLWPCSSRGLLQPKPWSGLLPRDKLMSKGCVELAPPFFWASWERWPRRQESRRVPLASCSTPENSQLSAEDAGEGALRI